MSDLPIYNGTVHPDDWIRQIQSLCIIKGIRQEKDILRLCKLNIDAAITLPNEFHSISELSKALKAHTTFAIFKSTCKTKFDNMKYGGGEDVPKFLSDFRSLCVDAEIDMVAIIYKLHSDTHHTPEETKPRLLKTYSSNEFFKNEFSRRVHRITSVDEIYKIYSEVISDGLKLIKFDTPITLKHAATGKYLSSRQINYEAGSKNQVVYAGEKLPNANAAWLIKSETSVQKDPYQVNTVFYDDVIFLTHKLTGFNLNIKDFYRSPKTGKAEVHGSQYNYSNLHCININPDHNIPFIKSRDKINIRSESSYILRSHEYVFSISTENEAFQEVVGHKEKFNKDDEWIIELK